MYLPDLNNLKQLQFSSPLVGKILGTACSLYWKQPKFVSPLSENIYFADLIRWNQLWFFNPLAGNVYLPDLIKYR